MEKQENADWVKYSFHGYLSGWIGLLAYEIFFHNTPIIFGIVVISLMATFSIGALMEVWKGALPRTDKIFYTIGFILVNIFASILFMVNRNKINKPAESE